MTDRVNVSPGHPFDMEEIARTFRYAGQNDGFVMPGGTPLLRDVDAGLSTGTYGEFNYVSSSGLNVTIDSGEAIIEGLPVARDTQTVVSLADNTSYQTVYVGWVSGSQDNLLVGTQSNFDALGVGYGYVAIWEFDTSSGVVTASRDKRTVGESLDLKNARYETSDGSGIKVDKAKSADTAGSTSQATSADKADAVVDGGDSTTRKVFVSDMEPAGWTDGDLWFKPK